MICLSCFENNNKNKFFLYHNRICDTQQLSIHKQKKKKKHKENEMSFIDNSEEKKNKLQSNKKIQGNEEKKMLKENQEHIGIE